MIHLLASLLVLFALVAPRQLVAAQEKEPDGRLILVAREEIEDGGLRRKLEGIGGEGATRLVLALTEAKELPGVDRCFAPKSRDAILDRELSRRVAGVDVLVLRGGTFMQWYETLFPDDGATYLERAIRDRVRSKKTVIAYGGACAFLCSGTSIPKEDLDETERNPRDTYDQVARVAMGLGPKALIDSDDLPGGSPLRLVRALRSTRVDTGLHLVGDVALDYRREGGKILVLGPGAVLAADLSRARRDKRLVREARLHLLREGDGWDEVYERPLTASRREPAADGRERRGRRTVDGPIAEEAALLVAEVEALARSGVRGVVRAEERWSLDLRWDEASSRFGTAPDEAVLGLALDLVWD